MTVLRLKEYHVEPASHKMGTARVFVHRPDRASLISKRRGVIFHLTGSTAIFQTNRSIDWVHDV